MRLRILMSGSKSTSAHLLTPNMRLESFEKYIGRNFEDNIRNEEDGQRDTQLVRLWIHSQVLRKPKYSSIADVHSNIYQRYNS